MLILLYKDLRIGGIMKEILNTVCDIGEQMLRSGAEVHRVEDSVQRMCKAIGASRADVFIITSSMIVTVYTADEKSYTRPAEFYQSAPTLNGFTV